MIKKHLENSKMVKPIRKWLRNLQHDKQKQIENSKNG